MIHGVCDKYHSCQWRSVAIVIYHTVDWDENENEIRENILQYYGKIQKRF